MQNETAADTARRRGEQREVEAAAVPSNNVTEEEEDKVLAPRRMRIKERKEENRTLRKKIWDVFATVGGLTKTRRSFNLVAETKACLKFKK